MVGLHRAICKYDKGKDLYIALCSKEEVILWKSNLTKTTEEDTPYIVVKVRVDTSKKKLKWRHWINGKEYGYFERIFPTDILEIIDYNEFI